MRNFERFCGDKTKLISTFRLKRGSKAAIHALLTSRQKMNAVEDWRKHFEIESDIDNPMQDVHEPCKSMEGLR
jgi:hypothetical protein